MAKFNTKVETKPNNINMAGGESFKRDFKNELNALILNSLLNGTDSFYQTEKDKIINLINLITSNTNNEELAKYTAKAMVFVRNEANMRSVSHIMANVLMENIKGKTYLKNALTKTLIRPDDATEIIALWNNNKNINIPNALRKAVKLKLENGWDSYQLKKYFGNGTVKVSNLINLTHPKPLNKEKEIMFKQALEGKLPNIKTAQTVNANNTGKNRATEYKKMLKNNDLGYMAALKNVRNILLAEVGEKTIKRLCNLLSNEKRVHKSKILPFRFVDAYNEVENISTINKWVKNEVLEAIEKGFIASARNTKLADKNEKIALLLDESGSMGGYNSKSPFSIGKTLMASILTGLESKNTVGYLWADNAREISIKGSPMDFIKNTRTRGGGTDLRAAFQGLVNSKTYVDKIVIFTDGQGWASTYRQFNDYLKLYKKINKNVKIIFWNVEGYRNGSPIKTDQNKMEVMGYSDKILELIPKMWDNNKALVEAIESINID